MGEAYPIVIEQTSILHFKEKQNGFTKHVGHSSSRDNGRREQRTGQHLLKITSACYTSDAEQLRLSTGIDHMGLSTR